MDFALSSIRRADRMCLDSGSGQQCMFAMQANGLQMNEAKGDG